MARRVSMASHFRAALALVIAPFAATSATATDGPANPRAQIISRDPVAIPQGPDARALAMRITVPEKGTDLPVAILSHGNLLNRSDYRPLVEFLARDGWIVIQPDHPDASQDGFRPAPYPSDTWRIRLDQVDWIAGHLDDVLSRVPGLAARADKKRLALLGHSFGGHTAALAMGAQVEEASQASPTPRFKAAVLLSAPGNWEGLTPTWQERGPYLKVDWSGMRGPVLMINGTKDMTPLTDLGPQWHDDGYRLSSPDADLCLMHIEGAGHYLGGIDSVLRPPQGDATPERRTSVLTAVAAFLDSHTGRKTNAADHWQAIRSGLTCKRQTEGVRRP